MEKDLIIEDVLERADSLSDTSILALLKRVENVALAGEEKERDLKIEVDLNTYNDWTNPKTGQAKKDLANIRRINKLLQENRPELYITYYPTENNELFKMTIEDTERANERRKLRGDYILPIPTQETLKQVHAIGWWTEEQARNYNYLPQYQTHANPDTIPDELKTKKAKRVLKKLFKAGYLNENWTLTKKLSITEKVALAYALNKNLFGEDNKWIIWEKIWKCQLSNNKTKSEERKKYGDLISEYGKIIKD